MLLLWMLSKRFGKKSKKMETEIRWKTAPKPFARTRRTLLAMRVSRARLSKYWLPVLVWMAVIFYGSSDSASFQHSSRIIEPLVRWIFPSVSPGTVHDVVVAVRKTAHLSEYAVLAILLWRALATRPNLKLCSWSWTEAMCALLIVILYAASDEFHQSFVPSREASLRDVLIDSLGGLLALIFLWIIGRWRQRW
jgi:VanZ family protein